MTLKRIDSESYNKNPQRYALISGATKGAPLCPYGNHYKWIGFDNDKNEFIRFTKSVFKKLVAQKK